MELSDLPPSPPTRPLDETPLAGDSQVAPGPGGTDPSTKKSPSAWSTSGRTIGLVALASFLLFVLVALGSAIDLPNFSSESDVNQLDRDQASESDREPGGGSGRGFGSGRDDLRIRPIPGCPDGFIVGDVWIVPDPEACGFRPIPPGSVGYEDSGQVILVPDADGPFAGVRVNPDGTVDAVERGDLRADDIIIGVNPDGSYSLFQADGTRIDVDPGPNGLDITEVPALGDGDDENELGQGFDDEIAQERASSDRDEDRDFSGLGLMLVLFVVLALGVALALGLRDAFDNKGKRSKNAVIAADDLAQDDVEEAPTYAAEISALDMLLWEIDQETDPRQAILRCYGALETGLNNPDMTRRSFETPGIYIRRILGRFDELEAPLRELTGLFEQARFSEHEITVDMRHRAVAVLVQVRDHYAHAGQAAQAERAMAASAPPPPGSAPPPPAAPPSAPTSPPPPASPPPGGAPPPPADPSHGWTRP